MERVIPASELIINEDWSIFHLHLKPEWFADTVLLVGDPGRVTICAIIADRVAKNMNTSYVDSMRELIKTVLNRL